MERKSLTPETDGVRLAQPNGSVRAQSQPNHLAPMAANNRPSMVPCVSQIVDQSPRLFVLLLI